MKNTRGLKAAALGLSAIVVLAACGNGGAGGASAGSTQGVTDDSILLGSHIPLTGPAAPGLQDFGPAWEAYFNYVNDNGGVHGRKISIKYYDDTYNPTTTAQVVRKLVQQDKVFALMGGAGTPTHSAVLDFINQNKVPDLFVSSGGVSWNQPEKYPYTFGWQPTGVVEGKIVGEYIDQNFADKSLCTFGQDGELGEMGVAGLSEVLGDDAFVAEETYTPSDPAIEPQITKLRDSGCEVLAFNGISAFAALTLNTAHKLNWKPTIIGQSNNNDYATLAGLVESPDRLEGFSALQFLPPPQDEGNSWTMNFGEIWDQYGTDTEYGSFIQYGMAQAYTMVQVLEAAGDDLTRESLIEAIEANGLDVNPGVAPLRYSTEDHSGYSGGLISTVKDGVFTPVSDVFTTAEGAEVPVEVDSAEPEKAPKGALPTR